MASRNIPPHCIAAAAAAALSTLAAAQTAAPAEPTQTIEVTASKRKERLQDTPSAISVIDSGAIERFNLEKLADYSTLVPNIASASGAGPGLGVLILRGLYTGITQQTATTVTLLGETPMTASGGLSYSALTTADPDLAEVERIEVLKGPQGTLYGASSLGGLIRIVPQRPDLRTLSGRVRLGASRAAGGDTGHGVRAWVNVPLVTDRLAIAATAFDRADPGFTRNVLTGADDLGRTEARGGTLTARFKPQRDLDLQLRLLTQRSDTRGAASQDNVVGTGTPAYGARAFAATFDRGIKTRYGLAELTAEWALDAGTLTASVNRARIEVGAYEDYTAAYAPLVAAITDARAVFGVPLNDPPFVPASVRGAVEPSVTKTSVELRFAARRLGYLEYLAGLYATHEKNHYPTHNRQYDAGGQLYSGQVLGFDATSPTFTRLYERSVLVQSDLYSTYRERALFGNLAWHLRPDLDATLGARHARNEQNAESVSPPPGVGFINIGNYRIASRDDATTFLAALRWRPDANTSAYVRAASGYRPGGTQATPNPPPTYAPDRVVNLEVGVKGRVGALQVDAAIYRLDWDKVQMNVLSNGIPVIRNGGRAKVDGAEAQLAWRATRSVSLGATLGLNRARITALDADTAAATGARPGNALPNSPRITAALWADHAFALWSHEASVGASVKHTGQKPASYSADALNLPYTVPAFTTLDLRALLRLGRATLRLGLDNATDENGISGYTTLQVFPGTVATSTAWLIRPRTLTASVAYEF
jgi:outer membrane receptor protein involved in Fe transport